MMIVGILSVLKVTKLGFNLRRKLLFSIILASLSVFRYHFGEEGCLCNFEVMGGNPVAINVFS